MMQVMWKSMLLRRHHAGAADLSVNLLWLWMAGLMLPILTATATASMITQMHWMMQLALFIIHEHTTKAHCKHNTMTSW
jgi:hypothetical protein